MKTARTKAVIPAFVVQTLLLFTVTIFLIFAGYLNRAPAFCLLAVLIVSVVVYLVAQLLYGKNNKEE